MMKFVTNFVIVKGKVTHSVVATVALTLFGDR
jgi:hypothetical protein